MVITATKSSNFEVFFFQYGPIKLCGSKKYTYNHSDLSTVSADGHKIHTICTHETQLLNTGNKAMAN
jgi:hypothetical protein